MMHTFQIWKMRLKGTLQRCKIVVSDNLPLDSSGKVPICDF